MKGKHGGARPGSGRPKIEDKLPTRSIKLGKEHAEKAKAIGGGNMSKGIRIALDAYEYK